MGQQQQGRPKQLPPRPEQVIVHLADGGEIGQNDASQLVHDALDLIAHWALYQGQLRRSRAQHDRPGRRIL
jgi:hypothetical protein